MEPTPSPQQLPTETRPSARSRRARRILFIAASVLALGSAVSAGIYFAQRSFIQEITVPISSETPAPLSPTETETSLRPGTPAPDFLLQDANASSTRLSSLRGKPVVLLFFASWNESSFEALRTLDAVYTELRDASIAIYAIDSLESQESASALASRGGLTVPILADHDGSVGEAYRLSVLPAFFFVGPDGILKDVTIGPLSSEELKADALRLQETP